ncbi:MAG TPA: response regulator transcription factor [Rubrobacter sp.]|nr:response regulator transcription factor [Rubrobacter sp.]
MKRILLVEDHAFFGNALALLLGHEPELEVVAQAGSLAEARERLDRHFDVAVVDLRLPDGDGRELIGELRRSNPDILVLVLSATILDEDFDNIRRAGADAVLTKVEASLTIIEEIRRLAGG